MISRPDRDENPELVKLERVPCPLCESHSYYRILEGRDLLHGLPGKFEIQKCSQCELVFTNPRPTLESIDYYYPSHYTPHRTAHCSENISAPGGSQSRFRSALSRLGWFLYCNLDRKHSYVPISNRHLLFRGRTGVILDIGAGSGEFLNCMRTAGWSVAGIETSDNAVRFARERYGIELFQGKIEEASFEEHSFDAITMWWSLEHVHAPNDVLRASIRLLKPGGMIVVGVPNFAGIESKLFGSRCFGLDVPRHLLHFTPHTLKKMLQHNGFNVHKIYFDIDSMVIRESLRYVLREKQMNPDIMDNIFAVGACFVLGIVFAKLRRSGMMVFVAKRA